jgi:hypothetical protein
MTALFIELAGLFTALVALRLAWLDRAELRAGWGTPRGNVRLWVLALCTLAFVALVLAAKFVMPFWLSTLVIIGMAVGVWRGVTPASRDSFDPAAGFFRLFPVACAVFEWTVVAT